MYMNKFLIFIGLFLASCGTNQITKPVSVATSKPTDMQNEHLYSSAVYGVDNAGPNANIAVLLPMNGTAKETGNNIKTSIEGFKEEIENIKTIPVSEEELKNAKNNLIGKQQFITETNTQQANLMAYYAISGKPFDYQKSIIEALHKITSQELMDCANKYFTDNFVLAVIKP